MLGWSLRNAWPQAASTAAMAGVPAKRKRPRWLWAGGAKVCAHEGVDIILGKKAEAAKK
ncbi:hypothetical protein [Sphingopyxis yananensis]|uniref:hypothetical protein n=1 Tax=Sphingopyxis yananensis TaxID=2886687 RepID=UPI001D118814|nr:hypothetical protein [Sphingopyxis yananensis]